MNLPLCLLSHLPSVFPFLKNTTTTTTTATTTTTTTTGTSQKRFLNKASECRDGTLKNQ